MATTDQLLFRIQTKDNPELSDDQLVEECMNALMEQYPQVQSYQYEREDAQHLLILVWFNEPIVIADEPTV